jgi:hypothetical protein
MADVVLEKGSASKGWLRARDRAVLGARLRAYYESMEDMPVPNHLANLVDRLAERIGESDRNADNDC